MSKLKLRELLTRELKLENPTFRLERIGAQLAGSIISNSFKRKSDRRRQTMIWDTLKREMGPKADREIGTLLAYTPEEWDEPAYSLD